MSILIADDNAEFCQTLGGIVEGCGWRYHTEQRPEDVLEYIRREHKHIDMILLDLEFKHPTITGIEILVEVRKKYPHIPVLMISGVSEWGQAKFAIKQGAVNFITKSDVSAGTIKTIIQTEMDKKADTQKEADVRNFMKETGLIGKSRAMVDVAKAILKYGDSDISVFISGETGTGKRVVAQALHKASKRKKKEMVTADMTLSSRELFHSRFFGHLRGSFSGATEERSGFFQQANNSTLFLDEIGDMPFEMQSMLLTPLDKDTTNNRTISIRKLGSDKTEQVDIRIIAATDRNIEEAIEKGLFRSQLYNRIAQAKIMLPPLRERREDIPLIVEHYLERYNTQHKQHKTIQTLAKNYLQAQDWMGNVRQLTNVIEGAIVSSSGNTITLKDILDNDRHFEKEIIVQAGETHIGQDTFQHELGNGAALEPAQRGAPSNAHLTPPMPASIREQEQEWRKTRIVDALTQHKGNITKAAAALKVSRQCLHNWMKEYGIRREEVVG